MENIRIDFANTCGPIKPMNGVNNGPLGSYVRKTSGFQLYQDLEIPFARLHDSAFSEAYGGEYSVDVHRVFPNFDADEKDPASYIFEPTDKYIASIVAAGTKPFYRLGASIEHGRKRGTYPPKDFAKWARICEHIIRHYTEGWADGFEYDMEYWEIWNEPDCYNWDGSNPCWQGTDEEFLDFYEIAAKYLKGCFPHLKIGGPAFAGSWPFPIRLAFCKVVKERNIPLDFFSFHMYLKRPDKIAVEMKRVADRFAEYGLELPEVFIDEWNYVRAWSGDDYEYTMDQQKKLKGASVVAGTMCVGQASPVHGLMYYNAGPGGWNGLYTTSPVRPLKTYYTFRMFRDLRRLGTHVKTEYRYGNVYVCAATDGKTGGILLTNYSEHDSDLAEDVTIDLENIIGKNGMRVKIYKLDEEHNGDLVYDESYEDWETSIRLHLDLFTTCYIEIIPAE